MASMAQKYYMEYSRNKQCVSVKLHVILNTVIKSHTILLCPAQEANHPIAQCGHPYVLTCLSHLIAIWIIRLTILVLQCWYSSNPYFT